MAQSADSSTEIVNKMLKVDGRGWNISLFEDVNKISICLCAHCGAVCCDTVELGCDHNEDDIFLYCHICLSELIKNNDNKCMISGHNNPPLDAARSIRRQISKAIVICPYSIIFKTRNNLKKNKNDIAEVIDTLGGYDEKEGVQIPAPAAQPGNDNAKLDQKCEWKGILSELKSKHIIECTKKNDPTFTLNIRVKQLENETILLKHEIINLENKNKNIMNEFENTQKELNNKNEENKKLKEIIKDKQTKMSVLDNDNKNLMNELNKLKTNTANNQKQSNDMNEEIKKLKAIIGDKEIEINKLNNQISSQSLIIKDVLKSNDEKNKLSKILETEKKQQTSLSEELSEEIALKKVYKWNTEQNKWMNVCNKSTLQFYKENNNGKNMILIKDNSCRMINHMVPNAEAANLKMNNEKWICGWTTETEDIIQKERLTLLVYFEAQKSFDSFVELFTAT